MADQVPPTGGPPPTDGPPQTDSPPQTDGPPPTKRHAAAVLRRALLVWGLGHLAIGDRRGLILLVLQPVAIAAVLFASFQLLNASNWILLLPAVILLLATWVGQAVHAHQQAVALGAVAGGELQIAWLLPPVAIVVTSFWLLGGHHSTPAATLREYVSAWQSGRPIVASELFLPPVTADELHSRWSTQKAYLEQRVAAAASLFGPASGLDPQTALAGLRFTELTTEADPGSAVIAIDIVRRQRVETMLLGVIPTASQVTLPVERAGTIRLRAEPALAPDWAPGGLAGETWLIERVEFP